LDKGIYVPRAELALATFGSAFWSATLSLHGPAGSPVALRFVLAFSHLGIMFGAPFSKLLHSCCFVEKAQLYTAQQMFQVQYSLKRQDAAHRIGWLGTFVQPVKGSLPVNLYGSRNGQRIVRTKFLNEFTVAGTSGIGNYDEVKWPFL
jgi:hypothetical protein